MICYGWSYEILGKRLPLRGGSLLKLFDESKRWVELGLMERGTAFVAIGAGFFCTNFILHKKWRAT